MLMEKPQCNFQNCRYCFDGNCRSADKYENCKLTDLHYEIARLTVDLDNAKSEWISVDEKLPEHLEKVLVCDDKQNMFTALYVVFDNGGFDWCTSVRLVYKVTHWMPLPMPPKGDEG